MRKKLEKAQKFCLWRRKSRFLCFFFNSFDIFTTSSEKTSLIVHLKCLAENWDAHHTLTYKVKGRAVVHKCSCSSIPNRNAMIWLLPAYFDEFTSYLNEECKSFKIEKRLTTKGGLKCASCEQERGQVRTVKFTT